MAIKKPMKKAKRYNGGGDIEESAAKQRGLDVSNKDEPVGFFERIRAGNIDDPSSEAYKRFGAGRGRADRIPVEDRVPTSVSQDASKVEMDEMEAANARPPIPVTAGPRADMKPSASKPIVTTASKPISTATSSRVSKEELEKSGMSLRDYLNKQQGLTRKESAKAAVPDAEALEKKRVARYTPPGSAPKQSMGRQRQPFMPGDVDNSFPGAKFKDGGKVRSASARADGIAIRGKTRA
jgi:hypothetical protein